MNLIILFLGVLSLVYKGECQVTAWTVPVVATKDGTATLTYAEDQAPATLTTLVGTGGNDYSLFSQPTTGKLAVATGGALTLEASQWFDFETEPTYVIVVLGGDGTGSGSGTVTITISITDVTGDANYGSFTAFHRIDDAAVAATTIATIAASGGTSTVYSIVSGDTNTDFAYAAGTGVLTTAKVMARSTTAAYTIVFQAVAASMTSTATVYVCVGTIAQCGTCSSDSGAAGLQISLVLLLVAIVTSRIK